MGLETSTVYKCLEKKTLILGFEVVDLLILSLLLRGRNFVFVNSAYKLVSTFGPVAILAVVLRLMNSGKADNVLLHWIRVHFSPGIYKAWPACTDKNARLQMRQKGKYYYAGFKPRKRT